jgi:alpha-mannosidase
VSPTVHIVPHTHWDREWYHTAPRFQLRLARLVDGVLDLLEKGHLPSFLLDGQGVVLDDYVALRPEAIPRLARQLKAGRLESGPWYVLADNLLVSGEAMVRNLFEGGRAVRRFGGKPMSVGYAPDTFGHPAILPTVLAGFGIRIAVTWRGLGGVTGQERDLYRWRGPDGAEALMIHLPPQGYENGANLPVERRAARRRWAGLRATLERRACSPHWLVMNGADHHVAQEDLAAAVKALETLASDCTFTVGSFGAYAQAVERWARRRDDLPVLLGELRDGRRSQWVLQGTHSARLHLKQENAACQRLLERRAEPLAVLAARRGADLRGELRAAWHALLENHPHDSICGTSTDEVHAEMTTRFAGCRAMADEIVAHATDVAIGHDPGAARALGRRRWSPALLLFNPSARPRGGIVEASLALFRADVRVGQQGSAADRLAPRRPGALTVLGPDGTVLPVQELGREDGHDRLESPRYYPDCDAVEWRRVVIAAPDVPPLGVVALRVVERAGRAAAPRRRAGVRASEFGLENEHLILRVESDGTVALSDRASGRSAHGLGAIECVADEGDSYTSSPRGPNLTRASDAVAVRVVHAGALRGRLEVVRRWDSAGLAVTTHVQLDALARHVEFGFEFLNAHGARRVRAAFPLSARLARVVADGPFGPVERPARVPRPRAGDLESADPCAPMQRYVSVAGGTDALTVFADGLPQYEARPDGTVFITLLRAFDQLSRRDIPERAGHAGWPTATPGGRQLGAVRARLAVLLHGVEALDTRDEIEAAAEAFLAPPVGLMRRALLEVPAELRGPELSGDGLVLSAVKPAESGLGTVLRCYNATTRAAAGAWRVPWAVRSATLCRLDEEPLGDLRVARGGVVRFVAGPRALVTILLR